MSLLVTSSLPARSAGGNRLSCSTKGTQFIFIRVFINWISTRVLNKQFDATFSRSFSLWTKCFINLSGLYKNIYLKFFFLYVPEARHQLIATVRETLLQHFFEVNYVMRNRHNAIFIINIPLTEKLPHS